MELHVGIHIQNVGFERNSLLWFTCNV